MNHLKRFTQCNLRKSKILKFRMGPYRKRLLILICASIISFLLGNNYFFQSFHPPLARDFPRPCQSSSLTQEEAADKRSGEFGMASSAVSLNPKGKAIKEAFLAQEKYIPTNSHNLDRKRRQTKTGKEELVKTGPPPTPRFLSGSQLVEDLLDDSRTPRNTTTTSEEPSIFLNMPLCHVPFVEEYRFLHTKRHLLECRKLALERARKTLKREMSNYTFLDNTTLQDHLFENGGKPIHNIVVTTLKSGSSFLGETINAHPGTFYNHEPLMQFYNKQVRGEPNGTLALRTLRDFMNCNYHNLTDMIDFGYNYNRGLFVSNTRIWNYCYQNAEVCADEAFLEEMCKLFPIQATKTVRIRLKLVKQLLQDPELDLRVVYLIRDPRATMQSRLHQDWCMKSLDCSNPQILCNDLEIDFYEAKKLRADYPDRFMAIRFEDLAANVVTSTKKILRFFRLRYHNLVDEFLAQHTKEREDPSDIYRDTKSVPFHWIKDLRNNASYVRKIQDSCSTVLKLWGYNLLKTPEDLTSPDFHPVNSPPWLNMT